MWLFLAGGRGNGSFCGCRADATGQLCKMSSPSTAGDDTMMSATHPPKKEREKERKEEKKRKVKKSIMDRRGGGRSVPIGCALVIRLRLAKGTSPLVAPKNNHRSTAIFSWRKKKKAVTTCHITGWRGRLR